MVEKKPGERSNGQELAWPSVEKWKGKRATAPFGGDKKKRGKKMVREKKSRCRE